MNMITRSLLALTAAVSLSACASMNVFKDSNSEPQAAALAPEPDLAANPSATLTSAQIKALLTGKSWRWTGPKNSGVTLYASDGTSLVEVAGKGTTGGKWIAKDGQLCESFSPASFIPQGVPMACQSFTGSGGTYRVGQATFTIAS
jgi:Protein of unknown function (DUF995)